MLSKILLTTLVSVAAVAEVGQSAPGFTLSDSRGIPVRLADCKGRAVLLNFWSTSCGACRIEIPWLIEFRNKYKTSELMIIGVALDEDGWKSVKPFLKAKNINYPVVIGTDDLSDRYRVDAIPLTVLIDRQGKIAFSHVGLVDREIFEKEIRTLLK
jgi:peroxiredoxin